MSAPPPFLKKLFALVSEIDPIIASWDEPGTSFIVHRPIDFQEVLKNYFKGTQQTFIRQLHFYGFSKTDLHQPDAAWAFAHPKFHRDNIDALFQIQRKTNKGANLAAMRAASVVPTTPIVNHFSNSPILPPPPLPPPSHSSSVSSSTSTGYHQPFTHHHAPLPVPVNVPSSQQIPSQPPTPLQSSEPIGFVTMADYNQLQDQVVGLQEQLKHIMAFVGMSQSSFTSTSSLKTNSHAPSSSIYGNTNHHGYNTPHPTSAGSHHHHNSNSGYDTRSSSISHEQHSNTARGRSGYQLHNSVSSNDHGSHGNSATNSSNSNNNKHDLHHDDSHAHGGRASKKSRGLSSNDLDMTHSLRSHSSHQKSPNHNLGDYVSAIPTSSANTKDSFKVAGSPMSKSVDLDLGMGFFFDDASSFGSLHADDLMHELEIGFDSKINEEHGSHDSGTSGGHHHHHHGSYSSNGHYNHQDNHDSGSHHHSPMYTVDPDHELPPGLDINLVKQVFMTMVKMKMDARKKNIDTALSSMLRALPDPEILPEIHEESPVTDRMELEVIPQVQQVAPTASVTMIRKAIRHCYERIYNKYVHGS